MLSLLPNVFDNYIYYRSPTMINLPYSSAARFDPQKTMIMRKTFHELQSR